MMFVRALLWHNIGTLHLPFVTKVLFLALVASQPMMQCVSLLHCCTFGGLVVIFIMYM